MDSSFAWLDYSETERRRMLEAISGFRESDTLDEIGIGAVRDAFSDLLFPGTSVIQTRARYLLFIPWIYLRIEHDRVPSSQAGLRARKLQVELARALQRGETSERGIDLAKAASIERHGGPGTIGLGFVRGLGLERGAVASSVAHDNHNLLVVGMDDDDMLFAVDRLQETGGGMIAVADGEVLALVPLPIAGLVSDRPVAEVAEQLRELEAAYRALGSRLESPYMLVSFLSLGVIPALRLTNRGLVDGVTFTLVPPLVA